MKKKKNKTNIDDVGLDLLIKDDFDPAAEMELTMRVLTLVKSLLEDGKKRKVLNFLSEHKHHLDPLMKELISAELKQRS